MKNDIDAKAGFDLGWEFGMYGIVPPEDAPQCVFDGHKASVEHFGPRKRSMDRHVRKWLQLRLNALRRGRAVDASVTPEFLRNIDNEFCCITRERLTRSTGLDTDWSIDRIHNNGAYSDLNLVIMSTKANLAKGAKTFHDLVNIEDSHDYHKLSPEAWKRLLALTNMTNPDMVAIPFPMVLFPPPRIAMNHWQFALQFAVTISAVFGEVKMLNQLIEALKGKKTKKHICQFVELYLGTYAHSIRKGGDRYGVLEGTPGQAERNAHRIWTGEDVWAQDHITDRFLVMREKIDSASEQLSFSEMQKHVKSSQPISYDDYTKSLRLDSNGYETGED